MDNISVLPFKFKYLPHLKELLLQHNSDFADQVSMKTLPKIGYIALLNKQPIAIGFLRRVEGGTGQIDCLVSNPFFGSQIRHIGISKITENLISDAKDLKLQGIIAYTVDKSIISRAEAIGFHVLEHSILALRLRSVCT